MKQLILFILATILVSSLHAQNYVMNTKLLNGSETTLPTENIRKITFDTSSGLMNVLQKSGALTSTLSQDIRHLTFAAAGTLTYTIAATAGSNGSINPSGTVNVNYGTDTMFTFLPNSDYHIDSVIVDGNYVGSQSSHQFTNVTEDHTIHVTFARNSYIVTSSTIGEGTISPLGQTTVNYGDSLVFTVSPNSSCYKISKITLDGDSVSASSPYTLRNITATHTVTAYFVQKTFSITESHGANGSISPSGVTPVNCGDSVVYTISPNTGYRVAGVTIDGETNVGAVTSYTFYNVTSNRSIAATFSFQQFTITASTGENGSISPSGNVIVNYNGSQTFTITPNTDYKIDSVFVDDVYVGKDTSYTFDNVTANHTISVTFKASNNLPIATSLSDSVEKNRSKIITLIGEDPEGGSVTYFLDDQPLNGTIRSFNSTTGEVLYRPDYSFVGLDSFSFYCRDSLNALSNTAWCIITVYQKIDSTSFRSFSQSDLKTAAVKKPKKGIRPMPTTGNVLDSLFINGLFKKLKDKTNPNFPGGMVLGVAQSSKDSAKKYGWIRLIGKSKDVQKSFTQTGSPRGFDVFSNNKTFTKELKNPKTDKYSNQLAGELLALKVNIAASQQKITNEGFGNLVYDNPQQNPDTFVTQRLKIQGKTLAQISAEIDTMLTYNKRYYTGTTPTEEYSKITTAILAVNEAFRSAIDTMSWSPLQLTSDVRIDGIEFLRKGSGKEMLFSENEFASSLPENMLLLQNYPNPFNPVTVISYSLLVNSIVSLQVFDVLGREVAMLLNNEVMEEGEHEIQFDANGLTSGVYFYRLSVGQDGILGYTQTRKLLLLK
ncbi:MAG: T9SS type A sorting domain-containing protein [Ignavibacteriales bacterium]|nr:T9SS type A sorting domain-containing protein [Ignavibacteriales bacterium]